MRLRLWLLGLALVAGCSKDVIPFDPLPPRPPPGPPTPPTPPVPPQPPPGVATWAGVEAVKHGMTRAEVDAALGVAPAFDTDQGDGTRVANWASVDEAGKPEWLSVTFRGGFVIGRARIPRAPPPAPVAMRRVAPPRCRAPVRAAIPAAVAACVGGDCGLGD